MKEGLKEYLGTEKDDSTPDALLLLGATAAKPVATEITVVEPPNVANSAESEEIEVSSEEEMFEILACLCAIEMLAKDLHYRAKGKPFYGIHLLSDEVSEISKQSDDINEVFYMGERSVNPPKRKRVAARAIEIQDEQQVMEVGSDEDKLLRLLISVLDLTTKRIERVKKDAFVEPMAGVHAVLDAISQECLKMKALVAKTSEVNDRIESNQPEMKEAADAAKQYMEIVIGE